jgi:poly-gamma-glutamate synthesis protein (capsule biosynthesis protein)
VALTGDVIMNTRVSTCRDPEVVEVLELLRTADVTHAHLEIPLHDFGADDVFPAAEGALSWMRGPSQVAEELVRCGVDLVSTASNHALDYSYGGLRHTIAALDRVGLPHAGTGRDLAEAREPAFLDAAPARVALVSATSSFPAFGAAGATRTDMRGRPGVSPMRYVHVVDPAAAERIAALAGALGLWVLRQADQLAVHPPGLHNSLTRFRIDPAAAVPTTACDPDDLAGYLGSLRSARSVADFVIAHLHVQAWDGADGRMSSTPAFARELAHRAVAAGASVVLLQGSHAPLRGVEVYDGVPVIHDPGPLFRLGRREVQPQEFYERWGNPAGVRSFDATLLDAYSARDRTWAAAEDRLVLHPSEGVSHRPGAVLPVCEVDARSHRVTRLDLYPITWSTARAATTGFPTRPGAAGTAAVLARLVELSAPYGVVPCVDAGYARIDVPSPQLSPGP